MTSVNYAPQVLKLVLHSLLHCSFQIKLSGPFFSRDRYRIKFEGFFHRFDTGSTTKSYGTYADTEPAKNVF
jgi:hypothetical protein